MLDFMDKRASLIEREAVKITAMLLATEGWSKQYRQAPDQHAVLIKNMAKFQVDLVKFFKQMAKAAPSFINPDHYNYQLSLNPITKMAQNDQPTYNVDVVVNNQQIDNWDGVFIKVNLQTVKNIVTAGAQAGEVINKIPVGINGVSASIQELSLKQVANLVGKTVQEDGTIIDNPNAEYNIIDTVRNDIAQSVKNSLATGQTSEQAIADMQDVIADPYRAQLISNTESVNAYNAGTLEYGQQSGAVGKEWDTADDPCPICEENGDQDPIAIDDDFDSGDDAPPAHPNCLCSIRLLYQNEMDDQGDDEGDD